MPCMVGDTARIATLEVVEGAGVIRMASWIQVRAVGGQEGLQGVVNEGPRPSQTGKLGPFPHPTAVLGL